MTEEAQGIVEIPTLPLNAQASLLRDEAIATFTSRNRLREAFTTAISKMVMEGKDVTKLMAIMDQLCAPDAYTKQILDKLLV